MAENSEHIDQIIGLTDLMIETLQATIEADRSTADEYYRILEENSFTQGEDGTSSELQMVNIRMQNQSGQTQVISVPRMVLMPIPMLHISEATFEIEGNMCLNTTEETDTDSSAARVQPERIRSPKKSLTEAQLVANAARIRRNNLLRVQLTNNTSEKTTENAQSTSNLKISVKMTQSDMPSGLVNLLQAVTNNIQVKNE